MRPIEIMLGEEGKDTETEIMRMMHANASSPIRPIELLKAINVSSITINQFITTTIPTSAPTTTTLASSPVLTTLVGGCPSNENSNTSNGFGDHGYDEQLYVNLSTFWYCFLAFITIMGLLVALVSNMIIIYLFTK